MVFLIIFTVALISLYLVFLKAPLGNFPSGARLERMQKSPHFKNGKFENTEVTPQLSEGENFFSVLWHFIFDKDPRVKPSRPVPTQKTPLSQIAPDENALIWFGHSSYYIQLEGKKILVDPVLSGHASPVSFAVRAFEGTDIYTTEEIPFIDYLLITHDHYDHLDYKTVVQLKDRVGQVITGLGTGESLEAWGYKPENIKELDWNENIQLDEKINVRFLTARHFSGRTPSRNRSTWGAFALKTAKHNLFLGGDSGYGKHFAEIGKQYGPFDLALLENGQYDRSWKYIHMNPEETLKAARDLQARSLFPVHNSKFILANHAWSQPLCDLLQLNSTYQIPLKTPLIGEKINLDDPTQKFTTWWSE